MSNKIFLTSGLILMAIGGNAFADNVYGSYSYEKNIKNSCTADFLGGDGVNAAKSFLAQYTPKDYPVNAGEYLAKNGTSGTQCPANSYCPGNMSYTFSETTDQGIESCPTDYSKSDAGTSSINNCYRACVSADIENSSKVATITGGTVTKGGVNTCTATCKTGYKFRAASGVTNSLIGKENIEGTGYWQFVSKERRDANDEEGLVAGEFKVEFDYGTVQGRALCSTTEGIDYAVAGTPDENSSGDNCWCKLTGYTPNGGVLRNLDAYSSGVYRGLMAPNMCNEFCVIECGAEFVYGGSPLHVALFESLQKPSSADNTVSNLLSNIDASIDAEDMGLRMDNIGIFENVDVYDLTEDQMWAAKFSYGTVRGMASCNDTFAGSFDWGPDHMVMKPGNPFNSNSSNGGNCWCKITDYTPTDGSLQNLSDYSVWGSLIDFGTATGCVDNCAYYCVDLIASSYEFRSALFESLSASVPADAAACVANNITVTWNPANGNPASTNTCTYDGDITLPTAPEKTGYTFSGWKLVTGSSNE